MTEKIKKNLVVCLYGGPGSGKSTTAASLFVQLKIQGYDVELAREYVKDWVWEGREIKPGDQSYLCAKQARRERILFKDNQIIVTDSPLWLYSIYERQYEPSPMVSHAIIQKQLKVAEQSNFSYTHIFLKRISQYNPKGRFQTEEEAKRIDEEIISMLRLEQLSYEEITVNEKAVENILNHLYSI